MEISLDSLRELLLSWGTPPVLVDLLTQLILLLLVFALIITVVTGFQRFLAFIWRVFQPRLKVWIEDEFKSQDNDDLPKEWRAYLRVVSISDQPNSLPQAKLELTAKKVPGGRIWLFNREVIDALDYTSPSTMNMELLQRNLPARSTVHGWVFFKPEHQAIGGGASRRLEIVSHKIWIVDAFGRNYRARASSVQKKWSLL